MPIPIEVLEAELLSLPPVQRSQLLDRLMRLVDRDDDERLRRKAADAMRPSSV